jgi:hypothetical protein
MGWDGLSAATLNMNLMNTSSLKTMAQTTVGLAKNQLKTELVCSVDVEYSTRKGDTLLSFRDDKHNVQNKVDQDPGSGSPLGWT